MTTPVQTARPETPISDLVLWMSDAGLHHLPVVGPDDKLVEMASQTNLVAELLADAYARTHEPQRTNRSGGLTATPSPAAHPA